MNHTMSVNGSKISLTLTDLENLNLGQLVRLYQVASGPDRTEPPPGQRSSQRQSHRSTSQLDLEGHDLGTDFYQSSARNSRSHLLDSRRNSRHLSHALSTSPLDVERGEPLHDQRGEVKRNTSTPVVARQCNSRPLTPGQYDDAASQPDVNLRYEVSESNNNAGLHSSQRKTSPVRAGQFDNARVEPDLEADWGAHKGLETTIPMSQYRTFHPNTHQLDIGRQTSRSRPTHPEPAFVSHYEFADVPEDDVINPASLVSRSLSMARKPVEVFRTWSWSRASASRASRRSKRSQKIQRKPVPELLTWSGPSDPNNPINWAPRRKSMIVLAVSAITFMVSYASSIFSTAVPSVAHEFQTSEEVVILGISLYVLGFALGKSVCLNDILVR
jgi:hypothetical protein